MSILCERGLFIGVERQVGEVGGLLAYAPADATFLRDYFEEATGTKNWTKLRQRGGVPTRIDILSSIVQFASAAPHSSVSLLFFSGHGSVLDSKLILKAFDTRDSLLHDSGVPLCRILSELRTHGRTGKRFIVLLDCCRDGEEISLADDVPSNVCIVYACTPGSTALEMDGGGVFTRSIVESLRIIARETGSRNCSIQTLCTRVARDMFIWRRTGSLRIDVAGSGADRLFLPLAKVLETGNSSADEKPRIVLRYSFGSSEEYKSAFQSVALGIFSWYGISSSNQAGRAYVRDHFVEDDNLLRFDVAAPADSTRWGASDFVAELLAIPTNAVESIILSWPYPVKFESIKPIQYVVGGEWTRGQAEYRLTWKNKADKQTFRGVVTVTSNGDHTFAYLGCESEGCYEMPLFNLMPGVRDMVEIFRSV